MSKLSEAAQAERITHRDGGLVVPAKPLIPFIEGDGTGRDIWAAAQLVIDSASISYQPALCVPQTAVTP